MHRPVLRLIKQFAHSTVAPLIWPTRYVGPGTRHSWLPRGRRLFLDDLRNHQSISTREIYSARRIPFSPLWLDETRRASTLADIASDDFTNERKAGLVCEVPHGRLIHQDYVLTEEDDYFADIRFPRVIMFQLS